MTVSNSTSDADIAEVAELLSAALKVADKAKLTATAARIAHALATLDDYNQVQETLPSESA